LKSYVYQSDVDSSHSSLLSLYEFYDQNVDIFSFYIFHNQAYSHLIFGAKGTAALVAGNSSFCANSRTPLISTIFYLRETRMIQLICYNGIIRNYKEVTSVKLSELSFHLTFDWLYRLLIIVLLFINDLTYAPSSLELTSSILLDSSKHCILHI